MTAFWEANYKINVFYSPQGLSDGNLSCVASEEIRSIASYIWVEKGNWDFEIHYLPLIKFFNDMMN